MRIYIQVKQIRRKLQTVARVPLTIPGRPETLRELIGLLVRMQVSAFNARLEQSEPEAILSPEETEDMALVGKIAFGISRGKQTAEPEQAVDTAIQGFSDGLFRVFLNDGALTELDAPLVLREDDTITLIRLVMLTGGFF